ncbi:MAG: Maltodextrin ABC transporter, permease protein MdxF, partial [uncultured Rubrobacteraceae bacterium]
LRRQHPRDHQPADPLGQGAAPDSGHWRRRVEDDALHGAPPARRPPDDLLRRLRGRQGRRGERPAAVLPHHAPALEGYDIGRRPLPDARLVQDLRPLLGDEQPRARVALDLRLQVGEGEPAPVRAGQRGVGVHLHYVVPAGVVLYLRSGHADLHGGV